MKFLSGKDFNAYVIVTSDTCCKDPSKDESGRFVVSRLFNFGFKIVEKEIVEDDKEIITDCLKNVLNNKKNILAITVGGTGLCPRDVTPEATSVLYDRFCYGIQTALYIAGLRYSGQAALSRLTAGISGNCLIVNFPGKLKACKECLACLDMFLEHALEQIIFTPEAIEATHEQQAREVKQKPREDLVKKSDVIVMGSDVILVENKPKTTNAAQVSPSKQSTSLTIPIRPRDSNKSNASSTSKELQLKPHLLSNKTSKTIKEESPSKILQNSSPFPMIEYHEALEIMGPLSGHISRIVEGVSLLSLDNHSEVYGRRLAEDIKSKTIIPTYPSSTMDGFVVNLHETMRRFNIGSAVVQIVEGIEEFEKLRYGLKNTAFFGYQVNTGGRVPEKNFTVVPIEQTSYLTKTSVTVTCNLSDNIGKYVRKPGVDLNSNDVISKGTKVGPIELGVILSMGYKSVQLFNRPKIGVCSTGDELIGFDEASSLGDSNKVIDANGPLLLNLFKSKHYSVLNLGIAKDNPKDILMKIQTGLMVCEIIVLTGGASMGYKDYVKDVIKQMGGTIHFGRVNIKPGKPAAFASVEYGGEKKFIFSLPGNPVSAYITALTLVVPFIEHGLRSHSPRFQEKSPNLSCIGVDLITVEVDCIYDSNEDHETSQAEYPLDGRLEFVRGIICTRRVGKSAKHGASEVYGVEVCTRQQSSCLMSLIGCDCLIIVDPRDNLITTESSEKLQRGKLYRAIRLSDDIIIK